MILINVEILISEAPFSISDILAFGLPHLSVNSISLYSSF